MLNLEAHTPAEKETPESGIPDVEGENLPKGAFFSPERQRKARERMDRLRGRPSA